VRDVWLVAGSPLALAFDIRATAKENHGAAIVRVCVLRMARVGAADGRQFKTICHTCAVRGP
jgi:hypothetical protein